MLADLRRWLAKQLCPQLAKDSARLWYVEMQMAEAHRWLGEFPDAVAVVEWIDGTTKDHYRALGEPATGKWRHGINNFREELRARNRLSAPHAGGVK